MYCLLYSVKEPILFLEHETDNEQIHESEYEEKKILAQTLHVRKKDTGLDMYTSIPDSSQKKLRVLSKASSVASIMTHLFHLEQEFPGKANRLSQTTKSKVARVNTSKMTHTQNYDPDRPKTLLKLLTHAKLVIIADHTLYPCYDLSLAYDEACTKSFGHR